jgi:hypothetical protein
MQEQIWFTIYGVTKEDGKTYIEAESSAAASAPKKAACCCSGSTRSMPASNGEESKRNV